MRAYITLPELPPEGQMLPPGTEGTTEPQEALERAQRRGDALILLFVSSSANPILRAGKTTRELDPHRPSHFYPTERARVLPYPGRNQSPYKTRIPLV